MVFGYARISTKKQVFDRQIDALTRYGVDAANIEKEICSGTKKDKPLLTALFGKLRAGDKIIIEEFSRFGRSTRHVLDLIEQLDKMGVELVSLSEKIETQSPMGRLMVVFLAALCEFEAAMTRERVLEGLEAAKANGKQLGRKPIDPKKLDNAVKLYLSHTYPVRGVAQLTGVSVASLYRELDKRGIDRNGSTEGANK